MRSEPQACPELLRSEEELVARVSRALQTQQEHLDGRAQSADQVVIAALYLMELDRVRFILASYLRTRLTKIREQATYLQTLGLAEQRSLMSEPERQFLREVLKAVGDHLRTAVLAVLPDKYGKLVEPGMGELCCVVHVHGSVSSWVLESVTPSAWQWTRLRWTGMRSCSSCAIWARLHSHQARI